MWRRCSCLMGLGGRMDSPSRRARKSALCHHAPHSSGLRGLLLYMMRGWIVKLGKQGDHERSLRFFDRCCIITIMLVAIVPWARWDKLPPSRDDDHHARAQAFFFGHVFVARVGSFLGRAKASQV